MIGMREVARAEVERDRFDPALGQALVKGQLQSVEGFGAAQGRCVGAAIGEGRRGRVAPRSAPSTRQ